MPFKPQPKDTSWQKSGKWYAKVVGKEGHYYHQKVVIPGVLKLLNLDQKSSVLDLACGNGVLSRKLPKNVLYYGVDNAPYLITEAKTDNHNLNDNFLVGDVTKSLQLAKKDFTHATIILALQNIDKPDLALRNASVHLIKGGKLVIVLNHPCFRIPRVSSWGVDEIKKLQYRRIDAYGTAREIPIDTNPGSGNTSAVTWSFHFPLSYYSTILKENNFVIDTMEEWYSDKESVGKSAKMENRGRSEFPLFLTIVAVKK